MKRTGPIVAIDGPVGVGKSSVARALARKLGFLYIDTGAMYRAVTWKAFIREIDLSDTEAVADLARETEIDLKEEGGELRVFCDGEEVTEAIRLPHISASTSPVADNVEVRNHLVALQQDLGQEGRVVMEGRDIGTVVFPHAEVKIYLDADPQVRAQRRFLQLHQKGKSVDLDQTLADLLERDRRDRERPVGALRVTPESIVVDTTHLGEAEVIDRLVEIVTCHPSYREGEENR